MTEHAFVVHGQDELVRLTASVARGEAGAPAVLVLVGEPGIGKSTLLRNAVRSVSNTDVRVLFAAGSDRQQQPIYASLTTVVWPILGAAAALPPELRDVLADAFGSRRSQPPQRTVEQAVLALIETVSATTPLLLAIDDVDRFDQASRDVLAYVTGQLIGSRVRVLLSARSADSLHCFDRAIPTVEVLPLSQPASAKVVDSQTPQPSTSVRGEILRWAGGNPLALIEATRAYGRTQSVTFNGLDVAGPAGTSALFIPDLGELPPETRKLVLFAAAGTGHETIDAITEAAGFGRDFTRWGPAEAAGLLHIADDRRVRFRHPLIQTAAYRRSALEERRASHQALARSLRLSAPCRAWHWACAAAGPDETLAAALESWSNVVEQRSGYLEAARTLQRAAQLSPEPNTAARRYGLAAAAANFGGDPAWALTLSDNASHLTDDPDLLGYAALTRASVLLHSANPLEAFCLIQTILNGPTPPEGRLALDLVYVAASASYYSGETRHRRPLQRWLDDVSRLPQGKHRPPAPFPTELAHLQRAHIQIYADTPDTPHGRPSMLQQQWLEPGAAPAEPYRRLVAGMAGYVGEDSVLAARDLTKALELLDATGGLRGFTYAIASLAWALLDTGRWTTLTQLLEEAAGVCAVQDVTLLERETAACQAQLLAFQGDSARADEALSRAHQEAPAASPSSATEVALSRAAGWRAVATGDFDDAYRLFRQMFHADGEPVHFVVSHRGIADLAWAAARSGRAEETRPLINAIGRQLGPNPAVRLRLLRHQALALVTADTQAAEKRYRLAVFDPAGDDWPLERARARLHYGEWLRRSRRSAEARPLLTAALEVFTRLGAQPLAEIAAAELRAAGIAPTLVQPVDAFDGLTAQEQQIVILAASGLTNREIADRLNLSPRTIGSHLYHVYPKLGVSRRHELREFTP
jgi:tetratricopeptide (TPR) repeat protein